MLRFPREYRHSRPLSDRPAKIPGRRHMTLCASSCFRASLRLSRPRKNSSPISHGLDLYRAPGGGTANALVPQAPETPAAKARGQLGAFAANTCGASALVIPGTFRPPSGGRAGAERRRRRCGTAMAEQARDGAEKGKGEQPGYAKGPGAFLIQSTPECAAGERAEPRPRLFRGCWRHPRPARARLFRGRRMRQRNPNTERPPALRESGAEPGRVSRAMGDEERSAKAQAKGWSGEGQRSVAAVAEKRSDGCDDADDGSDGVQDAMTDEDARTRLLSQEPLARIGWAMVKELGDGERNSGTKQARDGAEKAKGKQRGEDCEGEEPRKAAGKLAENAGGTGSSLYRAPPPVDGGGEERRRRRCGAAMAKELGDEGAATAKARADGGARGECDEGEDVSQSYAGRHGLDLYRAPGGATANALVIPGTFRPPQARVGWAMVKGLADDERNGGTKQVRDGAEKAKGKQRGEDCEGEEQRKAAGKLAENAGGAPALVPRAPEAPAES
eukprot:gene16558-biopygen9325